jgi:hypothetical protein
VSPNFHIFGVGMLFCALVADAVIGKLKKILCFLFNQIS